MKAILGFYNIFWGLLGHLISILLGLVIPRLVIVSLGSESNGLLSSVGQILIYLNLLEAGIGTATLQALYKPVAQQDKNKINSVLSATNHYYKKVGFWYFVAVFIVSIIYPQIIKTSLPAYKVFLVIFFSGMSQVLNFFFQGKYRILLQAEGKNYVFINLGTIVTVCASVCKIAMLLLGFDVAAIQIMYFVFSAIQMIYIFFYIKKNYGWIDLSVSPNTDALSQRNSVLVHQISGLIFSNTDVLLLTYFSGLKVVSVYSMYIMLFGMIGTAISTINGGFSFVLGQTYSSNRQQFMKLYNVFETYNMALTFSLYSIATAFIIPFLKVYTDGITDINYVDTILPYLFVATYLLSNGRSAAQRVIEYAGHFKLTQNRSIIESGLNILISIIGVQLWGIYGVLIGTIVALLYRTNDMILYASKYLLNRNPLITYLKWGTNAILFVVVTLVLRCCLNNLVLISYGEIIFLAFVSCLIIIPLFFGVASFVDKGSFLSPMSLLNQK